MSRFQAAIFMIGLAAAKTAAAAQGYIYQGLVGTSGTPGAASFEAMAATPTGDLAIAYMTSTGTSREARTGCLPTQRAVRSPPNRSP